MKVDTKDLGKKTLEMTFEINEEELKPFLEQAAKKISEQREIKGFRKGHAPYNIVVKEVGEMSIYQTAANDAIAKYYYEKVEADDLEPVEQPAITVEKLAPGNPFVFKAKVALMPKVEICDLVKISVKPLPEIKVNDEKLEKVMQDLQKMRAQDEEVNEPADKGHKVLVDFKAFMDNVPLEGGQAKDHQIILGEGQMIPGFEDKLIGMKKDEEKEFELVFPKEYHAKHLAGKKALFKIKMKTINKVKLPEINDEFAKTLGLPDLQALKNNIKTNIEQEETNKAMQKQELEIIEKMIDATKFEDLPETLINSEVHKMMQELKDNLAKQGMNFDDYLKHLKKSEADLKLDFTPDAIKRVKTGLMIREIAQKEKIEATNEEIEQEKQKTLASYKLNPAYEGKIDELEKNLNGEQAKQYFGNLIANRKTISWIKDKVVEKKDKPKTEQK